MWGLIIGGSEIRIIVFLFPSEKNRECRFLLLSCVMSEPSIHMKNVPQSSAISACLLSNICGSAVKRRNAIGVVNKKEIKSARRNHIARACFQGSGLDDAAWRKG